jgi:hypothetical protein
MTYQDNGYSPGLRVGYHQQFRRPSGDIAASLMHRWTFDDTYDDSVEASGWTWAPQTGSPSFVAGVFDNAVSVSSTAGSLLISSVSVSDLDGGDNFTVSVWFKFGATNKDLMTYRLSNNAIQFIHSDTSNYFRAIVSGAAGSIRADGTEITTDGVWNFAAMTWDEESDTLILYQGTNGAALTSATGSELSWTGPRNTSGTPNLQCAYFMTAGPHVVEDLRVYSIALTEGEVQTLYDAGKDALGL